MKKGIHPKWHSEAMITCACGNTWKTGATVPELRTDICSKCHPFYTGEQRIVDTEGQVDRFMKRLQLRDSIKEQALAREEANVPPNLSLEDLGLNKRYVTVFNESGVNTVHDFLAKLGKDGDEGILELRGIGRKVLSDLKKTLKAQGYQLPETE